ncbi:hypothetical protein [Secundilactobacillus odoratitofui]|uniref:hypothetical protein n=1 Tax=Secundilactobacillus odoratitofui TaxID=480930 RepID=UPI000AFFC819
MTDDRYYQPQNAKDALRYIENLFNQYAQAPLTTELVAYHQKLVKQLEDDILPTAQAANQSVQVENTRQMIQTMQSCLGFALVANHLPAKCTISGSKLTMPSLNLNAT